MDLGSILSTALRGNVPALVWGSPGVGKTAAIRKWAADRGLPCWTVIASLREPSDFGGLPILQGDVAAERTRTLAFAPPQFAVEAALKGGVIFLDEITSAPPAVQAALLRAVMDRAFGDLQLDPARVAIIAAANPPEEAAGGWDLAAPLANRFLHLTYQLNPTAWIAEFPGYWGSPPGLGFGAERLQEPAWSQARSLVAGFIRARPTLLHQLPEGSQQGQAWPSPRTWDFLSRGLAQIPGSWTNVEEWLPFANGCVGSGAAREFATWRRDVDLPDPETLLANPSTYQHSTRGDVVYAVLSSVAQAAVGRLDRERWVAAWTVLSAAAAAGAVDIAAVPARTLARAYRRGLPVLNSQLAPFAPVLRRAGLLSYEDGPVVPRGGSVARAHRSRQRRGDVVNAE
jgi:hypothetical protein